MDIVVDASVEEPVRRMGQKGVCDAYSMATEAIAIRLADKMMFASGPGPSPSASETGVRARLLHAEMRRRR